VHQIVGIPSREPAGVLTHEGSRELATTPASSEQCLHTVGLRPATCADSATQWAIYRRRVDISWSRKRPAGPASLIAGSAAAKAKSRCLAMLVSV
jgi:hypothetical protein